MTQSSTISENNMSAEEITQETTEKVHTKAPKQKKAPKKTNKVVEYFRGVKLEMKKVVWPTRKELGSFTVVVIATCAAFALLFWGLDSGVLAAIKAICF